MDAYCKWCREPWDMAEFHYPPKDLNDGIDRSYKAMTKAFRQYGCGTFNTFWDGVPLAYCSAKDTEEAAPKHVTDALGMIYELSGDDMDGAMADIEDFRYTGMLDV